MITPDGLRQGLERDTELHFANNAQVVKGNAKLKEL
jgi:hypothetical protein